MAGAVPQVPSGMIPIHREIRQNIVPGYPQLADQIGRQPQYGIYRSFAALNAQVLLHLQAEITFLENSLRQAEKLDSLGPDDNRRLFSKDWRILEYCSCDKDQIMCSKDQAICSQRHILQKLRPLLKQYNEGILQSVAMNSLADPSAKDMSFLQKYLETLEMGPLALCGPDKDLWGSDAQPHNRADDLISIVRSQKEDAFSQWFLDKIMTKFFACGFHRHRKQNPVTGETYYRREKILNVTYYITTGLSSLLLVLSIVLLWLVSSTSARLGIVAAFNVAVSVCLAVFTTAPRSQVFAINAGFAAVQVVFIGTTGPVECLLSTKGLNTTLLAG